MAERLNLMVEDGIGDALSALAGGERKRGAWLSDLVRGMAQAASQPAMDTNTLLFAVRGVAGQVQTIEGRVATLEVQLAALIAKSAQ